MRRPIFVHLTEKARKARDCDPIIEDGVCTNGCVEADEYEEELLELMSSNAVSISDWERGGDMPIINWDSDFDQCLKNRQEGLQRIVEAGHSWLPWDVIAALPPAFKKGSSFAFTQGGRPSCAGHSAAFAYHASLLANIALGQPMLYDPINPTATWLISKNMSYRGGQGIAKMANAVNEHGNFPISVIGSNNITVPTDFRTHNAIAQKYQSGVCFMPIDRIVDRFFAVCRAGLGVFFGNTTKVNGSTTDRNGMRVATFGGSWNHAIFCCAYVTVNGTEYVFFCNSHGPRYTAKDRFNAPRDGAWMTREILTRMLSTATRYGRPGIIIPESVPVAYNSFEPIVKATNPGFLLAV